MIGPNHIRTGVAGLVGMRQPTTTGYNIIDADNLASSSGLYLDEISFFKGEYFIDGFCDINDTTTQKNDRFRTLIEDSAINVMNRVFNKTDFITREVFYSNANNYTKLETEFQNGFLGYRLSLDDQKDIAFKINSIWLEVDGSGDVEILLFNSHSSTPIETKTFTVDGTKKSYKIALNWIADNIDYHKGDWYLGFLYDGTLTPYERTYESSNARNNVKGLDYRSITFTGMSTNVLPDLDTEFDLGGKYCGINVDLAVYYDYTAWILSNMDLFARAIQLQACIMILNRIVAGTRSNLNERYAKDTKADLLRVIKGTRGDGVYEQGLERQLASEVSTLQDEVEKLRNGKTGGNMLMAVTLC